jgi:hypothetical protein
MKKLLLVLPLMFFLSGCLVTPVKRNFPEVPKELMEACPDLKKTEQTEKLSEVIRVVTENYSQYHECRIKVDTWIEWYKTQKDIFESVK